MNPIEQAFISALSQSPTIMILGIAFWLEVQRTNRLERRLDERTKAHLADLRALKGHSPNLGDD